MSRSSLLTRFGKALAAVVPTLHTTQEVRAAADRVRDREDCLGRETPYACGLEDGAISVAVELDAACTCRGRDGCDRCGGRHDYPEPGWATDQTPGA